MEQRHTIKVDTETLQALRILAAYHGKRLHTIVRELALNALQHAEQKRSVQHLLTNKRREDPHGLS